MKGQALFWCAVGAGMAAGLLYAALTLSAHRGSDPEPVPAQVMAKPADATVAELRRCQQMAEPDDACRQVWAANRRHFLGADTASSASDQ